MPRFLNNAWMVFATACMAITPVAPAWGVNTAPETPKPTGVWLLWVITVVIFAAMAAITFKNAKRSHQD